MEKKYDLSVEREIRKSWKVLDEKQKFNRRLFPTLEGKLLLHFHSDEHYSYGGSSMGLYQEPTHVTEYNPILDILGTKSDLKKYLALLHLSELDNFYYKNPTKKFFLSVYENIQKIRDKKNLNFPISTHEFGFLFDWKNSSWNPREKDKSYIGLKEFKLTKDSYLSNYINLNGKNIICLDDYKEFLKKISMKDILENVRFDKIKVKEYSKKLRKMKGIYLKLMH